MADGPFRVRIRDYVRLLLGYREPEYLFERELRLFQMQSWVYLSDGGFDDLRSAGRIAAVHFLNKIEDQHDRSLRNRRGSSRRLVELFENEDYRAIFDDNIRVSGGWSGSRSFKSAQEFDKTILQRRKHEPIVRCIVDYLYRIKQTPLDEKIRNNYENISHAQVFAFVALKGIADIKSSGSTIHGRWGDHRKSAIFIYVSKSENYKFYPPSSESESFIEELERQASDRDGLIEYFGKCAFVQDTLGSAQYQFLDCFPSSAEFTRIPFPATPLPLSGKTILGLENYKDAWLEFKNS